MSYSYTVTCTFTEAAVADEWIAWLNDEHLRDVCEAGALDAEVIRFEPDPAGEHQFIVCEVRYHFKDKASFAAYERDHAPRLREEGLKRFPPERGLQYARRTGEVRGQYPAKPSS
ncbi:MAG: DUF4286 family protein [Phycisphaerales bacterium]|nr:MAG: DUF4286 family protein [Phycisphaerales bacterium]